MSTARALAAASALGALVACATPAWERPPPPTHDSPVIDDNDPAALLAQGSHEKSRGLALAAAGPHGGDRDDRDR